ncbi:uncharacterized protein ARMOST_16994 [Armillaria ostoyae]|uniref:Uncharacterized protein n=1 Tax=Armillaria ostoyae TaxID=47428 RepID=A0A284RXS9_ARMOS|nr:uncharacterized protein ARMOST_16994 [Armillaria ostoyae]
MIHHLYDNSAFSYSCCTGNVAVLRPHSALRSLLQCVSNHPFCHRPRRSARVHTWSATCALPGNFKGYYPSICFEYLAFAL